jgi:integrase
LNRYVEAWLDSYPPDSRQRRRRLRALERFEKSVRRDAPTLLEKALQSTHGCQEVEDTLEDYLRNLISKGRNEYSATQSCREVRTFFTKNHARLARFPRDIVSQPRHRPTSTLSRDDVNKMIQKADNVRDQLVIAFLAQTGQRVAVLTAIKKAMIREKGPKAFPYGLVEVNVDDLIDPEGRNVNRYRVYYRFVIGREAMQLVKKMPASKGGWLFDIGERQIARIVSKAGKDADVQKRRLTGLPKRYMYKVHPNALRRYWKAQMRQAGVKDSDVLNFLMGNKPPYDGTSHEFSDEEVLRIYKMAEKALKLDFPRASKKRRAST